MYLFYHTHFQNDLENIRADNSCPYEYPIL